MAVRTDATELGEARRRVETLVSDLPAGSPFEQPWELRGFAMAVETVLAGNGALSDAALDDRTRAALAVPRTADHHEAHREPVAVDPGR